MAGVRGLRKAISESRMSAAGEGKSTLFGQARPTTPAGGFQLDHILECMDVSHISEWLQRTNETVEAMRAWWNTEDNAVTFQHFWLSEFDDKRRAELVELEGDLLQEELKLALRVGLESRQVSPRDILRLVRAVFREYPEEILADNGAGCLDLLGCLCSDNREEYRKLLSQVRCSTGNTTFLQWLLAIRSFCLVSVCNAALNFYRSYADSEVESGFQRPGTSQGSRLPADRPPTASAGRADLGGKSPLPMRPTTAAGARTDVQAVDELFRAVRTGHADVVHYMLAKGGVPLHTVDGLGRSLPMVAVLHGQQEVLQLLLENAGALDLNSVASSGNTALHAAVMAGSVEMAHLLLSAGASPDIKNEEMGGATPLMLATLQGDEDMAKIISRYSGSRGEDTMLSAEGRPMTARAIAEEQGMDSLVSAMEQATTEGL